jgi:hypothetical protein
MWQRFTLGALIFACDEDGGGLIVDDFGESHFVVDGIAGSGVLNPFDELTLRGALRVPHCQSEILTLAGPYELATGPYRQRIVFSPALSEPVCAELVYAPPVTSEVPPETVQVEIMAVPTADAPDSVRVDVVLISQS